MKSKLSNQWRVHLPNLLVEICNNQTCSALVTPLRILQGVLGELAECAAEINHPKLNAIMCRLSLYAVADPCDKENYDSKQVEQILAKAKELKP